MRRFVAALATLLACASYHPSYAGEIGFIEDFALAPDRAVPLKQLIPGTEDYYYYHALHYLNTEQFAQVGELLTAWAKRNGETERVREIRMRMALLTYDRNPTESLTYLRTRLGLQFNHQKEILGQEPNLPTAFDESSISRARLYAQATANNSHLNGFEDTALGWLVAEKLSPDQRRQLLQRLARPDYPNLVQLVVDDLNYRDSSGFGSFGIHRQLLRSQLDECLKLKPDLLNQTNFVQTYLTKLQPAPDDDWRHDPKITEAYLDRMWEFAQRLAPVHNSLKAHLLYQRLVLDRKRGSYDKERFLAFLQLPRNVVYAAPKFLQREESRRFLADLNADYTPYTLLPPIGNDEALVRSYLAHFFVDAAGYKEFELYVDDLYLKHLFAETKIVNGLGEPEQWASLLPPERFQQLKERVDIDFAFTNATEFSTDDPVRLDLHVKNVGTLIVKVFELNTRNYYRSNLREVDTDINLDGLVANEETTYEYKDAPLRRVARKFEFQKLDKNGVYVIDFIGNGRSSRALVRKGKLRHVVATGAAGQAFYVFDERNQPLKDARLWLGGHEYAADKEGRITVPFSTAPGRQPIVLEHGEFAGLDFFQHEAENYTLAAGIYVDRESLLTRKKAQVLVRPGLFINGTPISLDILEEVKLTISSVDLDGVATSQEIPNFKLFEDRESIHEFQVPARLAKIDFSLTAKVKKMTAAGQKADLSASESFSLNQIDQTEKTEDLHLMKIGSEYVVELLGRTGETKISRPVQFVFKHRDFKNKVYASLKTDPSGRIRLGALKDIESIAATGPQQTPHSWILGGDKHTYPGTLHGRVGDTLTLPYLPRDGAKAVTREEVSLLETRGGSFIGDRFENVTVEGGLLQIQKLPAGDYDLLLKSSETHIKIRIVDGPLADGYILGKLRQLETKRLKPIQIESIDAGADKLTIRLQNVSKYARVHVFGVRYWPAYSSFGHLARVRDVEPYLLLSGRSESVYLTGRNIGDEYRYIIDRKYAKKFPGNSLDRPSLLLNPWAVRATETGEQLAAAGDDFGAVGAKQQSRAEREQLQQGGGISATGNFADLDFLSQAAAVMVNLTPDKDGVVTIAREALGAHQQLHVVAVDPLNTTYRSVALPEIEMDFIDLRLLNGLDPQGHFTQQKQISIVAAGEAFTLVDITTSKFEAYDSLARAYGLYATLSKDPHLVEFGFIQTWPKLKAEEKRAQYSKYACHELNYFLAERDPEFFTQTIKPYLANKKDKTFVDRFLLGEDLRNYLQPWQYGRLNAFERALLARRIDDERAVSVRFFNEKLSLSPPNIDRFIHLFDTAVKGSALELDDKLGLKLAAATAMPDSTLRANRKLQDGAGFGMAPAAAAPPMANAARMPSAPPGEAQKKSSEQAASNMEKAKDAVAFKEGRSRVLGDAKREAANQLSEKADKAGDQYYRRGAADRDQQRQLYVKLDKTMEWAENNYYHLTIDKQVADLVPINPFWRDYAEHDPAKPFYTRNLAEASSNFPEMLTALAAIDLPFEAGKHETKFDGVKMTLTPGSPMIVYHEEIKAAKPAANPIPILVSQNFYRYGDRHRQENGEQVDKFVTEEFLVHTVYGCQVVVTNPTSARRKLTVLLQVPKGSIPVLNGRSTRTVHLNLEPYHTQTIDYHFYFPEAGKFEQYPAHVALNEELVTFAKPFTFEVVDKPTKIDTQSWEYVSQQGTDEEVLTFLSKNNVQSLNLEKIAFRMRDKAFFEAATKLLAARHVYQQTLWSYSLLHDVTPVAREFLQHVNQVAAESGGRINSPLLTLDPVARHSYEHLEYKPLVNARAHSLGKRRQILNNRFSEQYHRLLKELSYQRQPTDDDELSATYYLLLQDRVEEALVEFQRVDVAKLATRMQHDYFSAYLAFYTDETARARNIAEKYADYPVDRWKNTFASILAQLDEAEGKSPTTIDAEDRAQRQTALAATEPSFDFQVEAKQLTLNYQNLKSVTVSYYLMDVEMLFSRNPFVQQFSGQFSSIRPNFSQTVELKPAGSEKQTGNEKQVGSTKIALPESLHNKNVLVEITGGGETKSQAYYSHSLAIQVVESYGQVRVTHAATGKPISKAYVKVYAQLQSGEVRFYKDGYTDIRGRFDYASLNTNELDQVRKFSLLILSDESGAVVRETAPPKR
ncbi:MAG: hypothetical protein K8U03_01205 [Planctomycetia bacterium]|nr:hypothetical protein [Planctomycetia bacterium]